MNNDELKKYIMQGGAGKKDNGLKATVKFPSYKKWLVKEGWNTSKKQLMKKEKVELVGFFLELLCRTEHCLFLSEHLVTIKEKCIKSNAEHLEFLEAANAPTDQGEKRPHRIIGEMFFGLAKTDSAMRANLEKGRPAGTARRREIAAEKRQLLESAITQLFRDGGEGWQRDWTNERIADFVMDRVTNRFPRPYTRKTVLQMIKRIAASHRKKRNSVYQA